MKVLKVFIHIKINNIIVWTKIKKIIFYPLLREKFNASLNKLLSIKQKKRNIFPPKTLKINEFVWEIRVLIKHIGKKNFF